VEKASKLTKDLSSQQLVDISTEDDGTETQIEATYLSYPKLSITCEIKKEHNYMSNVLKLSENHCEQFAKFERMSL